MKIFRTFACAALLVASFSANAQFIVTDPPQIVSNVANFVEDFAQQTQQLAQLKSQYDALVKQYNAITGIRNLGDVLNNPAFRDYLGDDWQKSYDDLGKGYNQLSSGAKSIYDKYKVFDNCSNIANTASKASCYSRAMRAANNKATWTNAFDSAKGRISQIEGLMAKINTTKDAKAIAELQGRIQAEQALLTNQQTMLTLQKQIAEAEEELIEQREAERMAKKMKSHGGVYLEPLSF